MNKAIFFDKDGVLNPDRDLSGNLENLECFPEIPGLIAFFRGRGFKIIVVTNQPVVARGLINEAGLEVYFEKFKKELRNKNPEALIDRIYYCPHHPNANVAEYRKSCDCRKPKPGMIINAAREFDVDLSRSFMVGDRISDVIAGNLAGCFRTIQIMSGEHEKKMIETDLKLDQEILPDFKIFKLEELKGIIL